MKIFMLALLFPGFCFAFTKITCNTVERYNDQRIENTFTVDVENESAFKQVAAKRDSNIRFVTYYSKSMENFGARVSDLGLGTQSGNYVDPSQEKGLVKVIYFKNNPETVLFAMNCTIE